MTRRTPVPVRLALLLFAFLGLGVAVPAIASAHAVLVATDPRDGDRLTDAPSTVTLQFNETVSIGAGYVRVLQAGGGPVDTGDASATGNTVTVDLRSDLPDASYVVSYRVVSADSHPITGAFAFVVGNGQLVAANAAAPTDSGDPLVTSLLSATRWIGFGGLALGVGVPVFLAVCWPAGWADRRSRRLTSAGLAATALSGALGVLLQGPYTAGSGVRTLTDPALIATTLGSTPGLLMALRVVLTGVLAALLVPAWRRAATPAPALLGPAAAAALGLVLTTAGIGHAVAGSWTPLALTATTVHVAAMTVWFGGLVVLLALLLRAGVDPEEPVSVLPRWSRLAFGTVAALVVTGVIQSVREVGSVGALVATTYGWVLLVKLALVLLLLGAAGVSRAWVQQKVGLPSRRVTAHAFAASSKGGHVAVDQADREDDDYDDEWDEDPEPAGPVTGADVRRLRRSVLVEVAVGAVVLALSAVLVGTAPARGAVSRPLDVTLPLQGTAGSSGTVEVTVDPATVGPNVLHVYLLDAQGRLTQPADIKVAISQPEKQIGPLDVALTPTGPGHYSSTSMSIPASGAWTVTVTVRVDEFTAVTASTPLPVS
jgi:copper transport protein